jgi:hypothetical protein
MMRNGASARTRPCCTIIVALTIFPRAATGTRQAQEAVPVRMVWRTTVSGRPSKRALQNTCPVFKRAPPRVAATLLARTSPAIGRLGITVSRLRVTALRSPETTLEAAATGAAGGAGLAGGAGEGGGLGVGLGVGVGVGVGAGGEGAGGGTTPFAVVPNACAQ